MAFLASSFIVLATISQNYFYINHQHFLQDAFVCFSENLINKSCDQWPGNWQRLYPKSINNGKLNVLRAKLNSTLDNAPILFYKLKFFYMDKTIGENGQWNMIATNNFEKMAQQPEEQTTTAEVVKNPYQKEQRVVDCAINSCTRIDDRLNDIIAPHLLSMQQDVVVTFYIMAVLLIIQVCFGLSFVIKKIINYCQN